MWKDGVEGMDQLGGLRRVIIIAPENQASSFSEQHSHDVITPLDRYNGFQILGRARARVSLTTMRFRGGHLVKHVEWCLSFIIEAAESIDFAAIRAHFYLPKPAGVLCVTKRLVRSMHINKQSELVVHRSNGRCSSKNKNTNETPNWIDT